MQSTAWEHYIVSPWRFRVKLRAGEFVYFGHLVMRRRLPDGSLEYRQPTTEEAADEQTRNAW
jgi:hypothetical protein